MRAGRNQFPTQAQAQADGQKERAKRWGRTYDTPGSRDISERSTGGALGRLTLQIGPDAVRARWCGRRWGPGGRMGIRSGVWWEPARPTGLRLKWEGSATWMILMTLEGVWRAGGAQGVNRSPVQWAGADQPHGLAQQVHDLRDPAGCCLQRPGVGRSGRWADGRRGRPDGRPTFGRDAFGSSMIG